MEIQSLLNELRYIFDEPSLMTAGVITKLFIKRLSLFHEPMNVQNYLCLTNCFPNLAFCVFMVLFLVNMKE